MNWQTRICGNKNPTRPWSSAVNKTRIADHSPWTRSTCLGWATLAVLLVVCQIADAAKVVYVAEQDTPGAAELYIADVTPEGTSVSVGTPVKLNAPLKIGNDPLFNVIGIISPLHPNGAYTDAVVYRAAQDTAGKFGIYVVKTDNPGVTIRMNPLTPNRNILDGVYVTLDGEKLVYLLEDQNQTERSLMLVKMDRPGVAQELTSRLLSNGIIFALLESPDSQRVSYLVLNGSNELIGAAFADLDNPGVISPIGPFPTGTTVSFGGTQFSMDGSKFAFAVSRGTGTDRGALYVVDVASPMSAVQVNTNLGSAGSILGFSFSPDGNSIAYRAQQIPGQPVDVWLADLTSPGSVQQVNPTLAGSPQNPIQERVSFTFDGNHIIYNARQDLADARELYQVPVAQLGQSTKLSAPLDQMAHDNGGVTAQFSSTLNNRFVQYVAGLDAAGPGALTAEPRLIVIDRQNPGVAINPFSYPDPGLSLGSSASPDSTLITTAIHPGTFGNRLPSNLFVGRIDIDDSAVMVNPPVPGGVSVRQFTWMPTSGPTLGRLPGTDSKSMAIVDDVTNNSAPEIAVQRNEEPDSLAKAQPSLLVQLNDSSTGANIGSYNFFSSAWTYQELIQIPGIGANQLPALGLVATRNNDDLPGVQIKEAATGNLIGNLFPWSTSWRIIDTDVIAGLAPGGGPVVATLAERKSDGLQGVELRDPITGNRIRIIYPLGFGWSPVSFSVLNVNNTPAVAVLNTRDSDGLAIVQVRNATNGSLVRNVFPLGLGWSPVELKRLPDLNANGADEVAVRMTRDADGLEIIQIRDSASNNLVSNVYPIGAGFGVWNTQQFELVNTGNTVALGILSVRDSDQQVLLQLKDASTATILKNTFFIGPPWEFANAYQVLPDVNGNGTDDAAVLVRNSNTGDRLVQIRDLTTSEVLRNLPQN